MQILAEADHFILQLEADGWLTVVLRAAGELSLYERELHRLTQHVIDCPLQSETR